MERKYTDEDVAVAIRYSGEVIAKVRQIHDTSLTLSTSMPRTGEFIGYRTELRHLIQQYRIKVPKCIQTLLRERKIIDADEIEKLASENLDVARERAARLVSSG